MEKSSKLLSPMPPLNTSTINPSNKIISPFETVNEETKLIATAELLREEANREVGKSQKHISISDDAAQINLAFKEREDLLSKINTGIEINCKDREDTINATVSSERFSATDIWAANENESTPQTDIKIILPKSFYEATGKYRMSNCKSI